MIRLRPTTIALTRDDLTKSFAAMDLPQAQASTGRTSPPHFQPWRTHGSGHSSRSHTRQYSTDSEMKREGNHRSGSWHLGFPSGAFPGPLASMLNSESDAGEEASGYESDASEDSEGSMVTFGENTNEAGSERTPSRASSNHSSPSVSRRNSLAQTQNSSQPQPYDGVSDSSGADSLSYSSHPIRRNRSRTITNHFTDSDIHINPSSSSEDDIGVRPTASTGSVGRRAGEISSLHRLSPVGRPRLLSRYSGGSSSTTRGREPQQQTDGGASVAQRTRARQASPYRPRRAPVNFPRGGRQMDAELTTSTMGESSRRVQAGSSRYVGAEQSFDQDYMRNWREFERDLQRRMQGEDRDGDAAMGGEEDAQDEGGYVMPDLQ